jgi:cupin fold WbuC family metalloprotein
MSEMKKISNDVYVTGETYPSVGTSEIDFLEGAISGSTRGRVRLCMHKHNEDRMHEMFISFEGTNYVRPSKHLGKDESLHVINGLAKYLFFDDSGRVNDVVSLGAYSSPDRQFYCRIPANTEHALIIQSDSISVHESTVGPFDRVDTVFSSWSPEERDAAAVERFLAELRNLSFPERRQLTMTRTAQEVFVAADPVVSVGPREMNLLKREVVNTDRKRIRLCAHKNSSDLLHEMFVVYMNMTYVKPNKHLNKDESLHILEGEADFVFFDDGGEITAIVPLGDRSSGRPFYIRVPAFVYHTIVMKSDTLVIHEATPGPFYREDTVWAPWGPDEKDLPEVARFMRRLREAIGTYEQTI